jgi:methionyl aminopeptidase
MSPIELKSRAEIELLREANLMVAEVLDLLGRAVVEGSSTWELDRVAHEYCVRSKVEPAFLGLYGFPASLCVSINEEVVHGIPSRKRKLKAGDIVSCDFGIKRHDFYGDAARTFGVEPISELARKLLDVTEESLYLAIEQCKPGCRLGDIGYAIQSHVEKHGFSVVRDFVGHGIGRKPHEEPQVKNYGLPGRGRRLEEGTVLAIEPMVNAGGWEVRVLEDDWTAVTRDHSLSAHFEHSVAITSEGADILSLPRRQDLAGRPARRLLDEASA